MRLLKRSVIFLIYCSLMLFVNIVKASTDIDEPEGYQLDNYRSQTPATLEGAIVVNASKAKELFDRGDVIFIDVLPSPKRPESLSEDEVWLPPKRMNIPGSIWLADVGFGVLSDELENYFKSNLERFHDSNQKAMLFYCKANCWMSWNAAKRAINYGFSNILWFPGGTDDWSDAGYLLEESIPKEI